jgi:hypothetical protein
VSYVRGKWEAGFIRLFLPQVLAFRSICALVLSLRFGDPRYTTFVVNGARFRPRLELERRSGRPCALGV